jgi:hypothetical protein
MKNGGHVTLGRSTIPSTPPKRSIWAASMPFENLAESLATFVTLASIQLALRRLAKA